MYVCIMAHERAICRHPPRHSFRRDTERFDRSLIDQNLSMLCFYGNIGRSEFCVFVCAHTIFADGVFLTQISSEVPISV